MSSVIIFISELKTLKQQAHTMKEQASVSGAGVSLVDLEFCPR